MAIVLFFLRQVLVLQSPFSGLEITLIGTLVARAFQRHLTRSIAGIDSTVFGDLKMS
jgi:hypothetical protein